MSARTRFGDGSVVARLIAVAMYRLAWTAFRAFAGVYWRLEIRGSERLPATGAYVIAPVHRSNLDFLLSGMITSRRISFMAKSSIFLGGPVDWLLELLGAIPVARNGLDRAALRTCEQRLGDGEPVVVFPEGRRMSGDDLAPLYDGGAYVATRARVPVVPVGIGGSDAAMPIGKKYILPRRIVISIGEPIFPDVEVGGRVPRSKVTELTERVGASVQRQYDEARELAGA